MTRGMRTTTLREIRASLGRYLAIAAIIALGVGFFAGLRITTADMIETTNEYLSDLKLFDYRLASTIGFTERELHPPPQRRKMRHFAAESHQRTTCRRTRSHP